MNIAKRIRTLRQARHMTQSDLAGDQISREMISMIETGRIQPSLETLQYIARQLDITPAQILADETEEGEFQATALREKMFRRYDAGDWDAAIALAQSSEGVDDGVCLLLCQCYVRRGAACYENQKLSAARDAFNRALWYSHARAMIPQQSAASLHGISICWMNCIMVLVAAIGHNRIL